MERHYNISRLLDFYGEMLSGRQLIAMKLYYDDDLSLSEVAEELGISRQGVRASLKRSEDILSSMEDKLGLAARFDRALTGFERLRSYAQSIKEKGREQGDEQLAEFADRVISITNNIENEIDDE